MSKKKYHQVGKSKKVTGKNMNMMTKGFTFYTNMKGRVKTLKSNLNKESKEDKRRLSFVLIYFLVFTIASILFSVLYYLITFVYKIFSSLF